MYQVFSKCYDNFMKEADFGAWYRYTNSLIRAYHPLATEEKPLDLLDLGCGSGEFLIRAYNQYNCVGADLSKSMLALAGEKLKKTSVPLLNLDMRDLRQLEANRFDVVVSLFDTVNHLTNLKDLEELFKGLERVVKPGGIYIFDVIDEYFLDMMFPGGSFYDTGTDYATIWTRCQEGHLEVIEADFFIKEADGKYKREQERFPKRIFSEEEIETVANKHSFDIAEIVEEEELAGSRFFFILRKRT